MINHLLTKKYKILWIFLCSFFILTLNSKSEEGLDKVESAYDLYNERGYLKSNSFSYDGKEFITDYGGNLLYRKTLSYRPVSQNGLHQEIALTYNGSVSHTVSSEESTVKGMSFMLFRQ